MGKLENNAPVQAAPNTCLDYVRDTPALETARSQKAQSSGVLSLSYEFQPPYNIE